MKEIKTMKEKIPATIPGAYNQEDDNRAVQTVGQATSKVMYKLLILLKKQSACYTVIAFGVRRRHTIRVTPFWMLCNFRVWVPSWTG